MVDLSYVLEPSSSFEVKLRLSKEEENVYFYSNFIILKAKTNTRILLVDKNRGIIAGVHYKNNNGLQILSAMFTHVNFRRKGAMSKLLSYVREREGSFSMGTDFTYDGERFMEEAKNIIEYKPSYSDEKSKKIQEVISEAHYNLSFNKIQQSTKPEEKQLKLLQLKAWREKLKEVS